MIKKPKISVVLPVYNGMKYLKQSVESVLNQNFDNFEFLICDDCSADESFKYLSSLKDDRITLLKNEKNRGLFPTLNKLIKNTSSNYVHLWAQDDIMKKNCLEEDLKFFSEFPDVGFMFSRLQNINENGKIINFPPEYENRVISKLEHAIRSVSYGSMPGNIANVVLNKKFAEKIGFFNEKMKYSGDFDLWCRLSKIAPVGECGKILTNVRTHKNQLSQNPDASIYKLKENFSVYNCLVSVLPENKKKHAKKIIKWRHLPVFYNQFLSLLFKRKTSFAKEYFHNLLKYGNFFGLTFRWLIVRTFRFLKKEHWFYRKIRRGFINE